MNYLTSQSWLPLSLPRLQDQGTLAREAQVGMGQCVTGSEGTPKQGLRAAGAPSPPMCSCPAVAITACPSPKAQKAGRKPDVNSW